jgi:hypothetical protein
MTFLRPCSTIVTVIIIGVSASVHAEEGERVIAVPAGLAEAFQATVDASSARREASL